MEKEPIMEKETMQWWTTHEESKALLDAGLDPNTADMCYNIVDEAYKYTGNPVSLPYEKFSAKEFYLPCWSFGALLSLLPWRIRIADIAGMEYYLRVGKADNEFWVNYESEIADLPGTYIGYNTCMDKCSPTACAVKLALKLLEDGHIGKHKETEEGTGAMTDRENRWYIVRDMGLVCNQEFLDEVDKAIIEDIKKDSTMEKELEITELPELHEEDHASLRLSLLLKEKGFNWPCREWYGEKEQLGHEYASRMSQEERMHNTENETPGFICTAPTLAYAEKWLREEHGISIDVITDWEWVRDPMTMTQADLETPDVSEFSGYYYEIHQLRPHRLLYDSPVVSEDRAKTLAVAVEKALEHVDGTGKEAQQ